MRTLIALTIFVSLASAGTTNNNAREKAAADANAGIALHQAGRESEAKQLLERSWETFRSPETAINLAIIDRFTGDYQHAERVLRDGIALPDKNGETSAILLNILADILREEDRTAESEQLFRQASSIPGISWISRFDSEAGLADLGRDPSLWEHPLQLARENGNRSLEGTALRGTGEAWLARNSPARAEPLLRQALAIFEENPQPDSHQAASALASLAQISLAEGKAAIAEDHLRRALAINERVLGDDHPQVATILQMLAQASSVLGEVDLSHEYLTRAELIMSARFGENSNIMSVVMVTRGTVEQRVAHNEEAAAAYGKALNLLETAGPDMRDFRIQVMQRYAQVLKSIHRAGEARAVLAQVKSFRAR